MAITLLSFFAAAFCSVIALIMIGRPFARRLRLVDKPGGRKKHVTLVPLIGGLTIFPSFIALASVYGVPPHYLYFFLAIIILLIIGALDDRYNVAPRIRFVTQFIVAILVVIPGQAQIYSMGNMFGFGAFGLSLISVPFSIVATVLLINAVNLIDGLDGLSGGKGIVCYFWLAMACVLGGGAFELPLLFIMMGALAGFLTFNMRHPFRERASVFMGDAGSLALGLSLAWFSIHLAKSEDSVMQPISVAWILAIPIWDICGQFARRVREGRHPFEADLNHFHHHFIDAGISVRKATYLILLISFITGAYGVLWVAAGLPEWVLTYTWITGLFVHIYMSMKPERFKRLVAALHK